ncbi:unnamed protein product [Allacma fusca]|uniref:RING-type E3 ubiquitin transferase n=1 Tax=Allacma fusca TaxID=39272 RepID=A0A8J2K605_9HEXA|nr:unnamed protein product [Allacma fusca]
MADFHDDPHKYECPVCFEILAAPIFQCNNGHLLCEVCIPELQTCPICRQELPKKRVRNLEVEKIVKKQKFSCPNRSSGCTAMLKCDMIEDHRIDCLFSIMNFCPYLGIDSCHDSVALTDFVVHLMGKHKLLGEFVQEGTTVEICQSGALARDIQCGKVEWAPNFIVHGDNTFFLQTKVTSYGISWMISSLGSSEVANNFIATIKLVSPNENQGCSLSWRGRVCSLRSKFDDNPNVFCVSFLQTRFFWKNEDQNDLVSLKLQLCITKNGDQKPSTRGIWRINTPAQPTDSVQAHGSQDPTGLVVHEHVGCDGCHANPLIGPRYKCIECQDFDLCKDCIDKNVHSHHLFLRASGRNMNERLEQAHRGFRAEASGSNLGNEMQLRINSKCPICRGDLPEKKIKALEVEKIVRRSPFGCKFRKFGCNAVMPLEGIIDHELDCQFASSVNFCKCLGLNCKKKVQFQNLLSHLTTKHEISVGTLKYDLGEEIELSQDLRLDGRFVAPSPDCFLLPTYFMQSEETLFFLKTEWTQRYYVRWMVFAVGRGNISNKYTATIALQSLRDPNYSLKWEGNVFSVHSKNKDVKEECLTLPCDILCPTYMQETEMGDFHWKLRLKVTRKSEVSFQLFNLSHTKVRILFPARIYFYSSFIYSLDEAFNSQAEAILNPIDKCNIQLSVVFEGFITSGLSVSERALDLRGLPQHCDNLSSERVSSESSRRVGAGEGCLATMSYEEFIEHKLYCPNQALKLCSLLEIDCEAKMKRKYLADHLVNAHDLSVFHNYHMGKWVEELQGTAALNKYLNWFGPWEAKLRLRSIKYLFKLLLRQGIRNINGPARRYTAWIIKFRINHALLPSTQDTEPLRQGQDEYEVQMDPDQNVVPRGFSRTINLESSLSFISDSEQGSIVSREINEE